MAKKNGTLVFKSFNRSPLGIIEKEEERDLCRLDAYSPVAKKPESGRVVRLNRVQATILRNMRKTNSILKTEI